MIDGQWTAWDERQERQRRLARWALEIGWDEIRRGAQRLPEASKRLSRHEYHGHRVYVDYLRDTLILTVDDLPWPGDDTGSRCFISDLADRPEHLSEAEEAERQRLRKEWWRREERAGRERIPAQRKEEDAVNGPDEVPHWI